MNSEKNVKLLIRWRRLPRLPPCKNRPPEPRLLGAADGLRRAIGVDMLNPTETHRKTITKLSRYRAHSARNTFPKPGRKVVYHAGAGDRISNERLDTCVQPFLALVRDEDCFRESKIWAVHLRCAG